jgi:glycosyltransferase involved in cell wall biosynthesis
MSRDLADKLIPDGKNMPSNPKISVLIASYNHARFLPITLDSILSQTYQDFEVIIVDDGSSDNSLEILNRYAGQHSKIRVMTHPNHCNKGISASTNLAFQNSQGEYIAWLGSDDAWYPNLLARQVALIESDASLGMVYGPVHIIDENGDIRPEILGGDSGDFGLDITTHPNPLRKLLTVNVIPALTVLIRRECIDRTGLFDETLIYSDWEMWLRIMSHWRIGYSRDVLAMYRVHGTNISVGVDTTKILVRNEAALQAIHTKSAKLGGVYNAPEIQAEIYRRLMDYAYDLIKMEEAQRYFAAFFAADATLAGDARYLLYWLNERYSTFLWRDGGQPSTYAAQYWDFARWILTNLEQATGRLHTRQIAGLQHAKTAFLCLEQGDRRKARHSTLQCLWNTPQYCFNLKPMRKIVMTAWGMDFILRIARRLKKLPDLLSSLKDQSKTKDQKV